eukprot:365846-Chlamydomonas_euryale.AAC.10
MAPCPQDDATLTAKRPRVVPGVGAPPSAYGVPPPAYSAPPPGAAPPMATYAPGAAGAAPVVPKVRLAAWMRDWRQGPSRGVRRLLWASMGTSCGDSRGEAGSRGRPARGEARLT